jgi:BioD-like phosphotransacetylase family protein
MPKALDTGLVPFKKKYPEKFASEDEIFSHIHKGDRSDMIVTAIETESAGIILTNSFIPPPQIIAKAADRKVPMLSVGLDTYQVAKQTDSIEPLLMKGDKEKLVALGRIIRENVNLKEIT